MENITALIRPNWDPVVIMTDQLVQIENALARDGAESSDFDLNPDLILPEGRKLRAASVMVPLIKRERGLSIMLTKRASHLKHHPGQISFPGGKVEPTDKNGWDAARREAYEEIALPYGHPKQLGTLSSHETVTGFVVTPFVALIEDPFTPIADPGEVEEIFEVPLQAVTDLDRFSIQYRMWKGQKRKYYTVPWGQYYIWGATARILHGLADRMHR